MLSPSELKLFWKCVDRQGPDDCWEWIHNKTDRDGYGRFSLRGYPYRAHRISYAIENGDPKGLCVCHTCDNPICVNPAHLWSGTNRDNTDDKVTKDRQARGEEDGNSKLTKGQVVEILASKETNIALAAQYQVSDSLIAHIRRGRIWKHLEGKRHTRTSHRDSKTGVRGVSPSRYGGYVASVTVKGTRKHLGTFETVAEAAEAVQKARLL